MPKDVGLTVEDKLERFKERVGNATFAIETNLVVLKSRIANGRTGDLNDILADMLISVEKIKGYIKS